jgi:hypothetical protein
MSPEVFTGILLDSPIGVIVFELPIQLKLTFRQWGKERPNYIKGSVTTTGPFLLILKKWRVSMSDYYIVHNGILYHWGIKGMKWGVRRFQNKDGSLTPAGKARIKLSASEMKHISEKSRRSKLTQAQTISELKKITAPSRSFDFNEKNGPEKKWLELYDEISEFSGSWYNSEGASKAFVDRVAKMEKDKYAVYDKYRAIRKEANGGRSLLDIETEVVLGYVSPANRKSIKLTDRIVDEADYEKAWDKMKKDPRVIKAHDVMRRINRQESDEEYAIDKQYRDDILGIVLTDLGYKDSPEARELIRDTVIHS